MPFSQDDTDTLRGLAARCREIADSEANLTKKRLWTEVNDLCHSGPPLLLVSPEGAWREITPSFPVACKSQSAQGWERSLRSRIYQHDIIQDDATFEPTFSVPRAMRVSNYGIDFKQTQSNESGGAYHDEPVLTNLDSDLDKLRFRSIEVDTDTSDANFTLASETFGDLLDIQFSPSYWWTCGLTWEAIKLWGLENLMISMYDCPDGLHRLMKFLSDEMLNFITFFEKEELLGYNSGSNGVGSGGLGCTTDLPSRDTPISAPVTLKQMWGFGESQETVGISPDMFGEFIFPHQRPLLERFGLVYYGCCEASETRWKYISQIPTLRTVSVAPWSDQATCAQLLGRNFVYARKPNPSPVCVNFNEAEIRKEFEETKTHAGTLNTAMILKDTNTVENEPDRLARWVSIGREILGS
jgi:hypothetical protein